MKTRFSIILALLLCPLLVFAKIGTTARLSIISTIEPIDYIVAELTKGTGAKHQSLIKGNTSPHNFQLRPKQLKALKKAHLVLLIDPQFEVQLANLAQQSTKYMSLVHMARIALVHPKSPLWVNPDEKLQQHPHKHSHNLHHFSTNHDSHHHLGFDYHIWLSPSKMVMAAGAITDRLIKLDPANSNIYSVNFGGFKNRINLLIDQTQQQLLSYQKMPWVTFHDAFNYFAIEFGLNNVGSIMLEPNVPLSAQQLKNIVRVVKASNVKCIFAETQFNDKVVRKVASKSGINSYTMVNPLHHNSLEPSYEGLIKQLTNNVIGCLKQ